jgi:hypothetical protein
MMRVERDCERIRDGFLGQPVNSLTAVVIVAAGVLVFQRPRMKWVGAALALTGIGSVIFHGPMPAWSQWAHDAPLLWLVLVVAGWGRSWERWTQWPALLAISAVLIPAPWMADPLAISLTGVAVVSRLHADPTWSTYGPFLLLGAVALIGRLGATGGPLCDPDSLWQPHSLWHIGAAAAVTWWALNRDGAGSDANPAPLQN